MIIFLKPDSDPKGPEMAVLVAEAPKYAGVSAVPHVSHGQLGELCPFLKDTEIVRTSYLARLKAA